MNDPYPASFVIEFDRERLTTYFRVKYLLSWGIGLPILGSAVGFLTAANALDHSSGPSVVWLLAGRIGAGLGVGFLLALVVYALFCHRRAARRAAYLEISVEGPFLRVRQRTYVRLSEQPNNSSYNGSYATSDRKLHFRSIIDYAVVQDSLLRRCGISALQMTTPAGGFGSMLCIPGVKDCLKVRDMLSEIDALRENQ